MLLKVQIEVTNYCNFNCPDCYTHLAKRKKGFMDLSVFKASLDLCNKLSIKETWLHNWGEPLLHPRLMQMVGLANKNGFSTGFTTNGYYLNTHILQELKNNGLDFLDISINAETSYNFGSFLKDIYFYSKTIGITTSFRVTVSNKEAYESALSKTRGYAVKWQRLMLFDSNYERKNKCPVINKLFVICWDGTIVPCCQVYDNQIVYGDIFINHKILLNKIESLYNDQDNSTCKICREVDCDLPIIHKLEK